MIRQSFNLLAAGLFLALASGASAAEKAKQPIGVVELFTSQGCNSCPPADVFLGDLLKRGDVVALAYHVDYWDYLGWRDTLATADNTARQRAYGRSFGANSVYTPQMVVNGRVHEVGSRRGAVTKAIESRAGTAEGLTVDLSARYSGENIVIDTGAGTAGKQEAHVVLVNFDKKHAVEIERGENRGKTIAYLNAVTDLQTVGVWKGKEVRFELPISEIAEKGDGGCAILLQAMEADGSPGPILGATMVVFPSS